jgi:hypothetical protein
MHDKNKLCDKIRSIYPEVGECGIDLDVEYSQENGAWVVDLKKDDQELKTFLEPGDADACMEGRKCVHLATEINQLVSNINKRS